DGGRGVLGHPPQADEGRLAHALGDVVVDATAEREGGSHGCPQRGMSPVSPCKKPGAGCPDARPPRPVRRINGVRAANLSRVLSSPERHRRGRASSSLPEQAWAKAERLSRTTPLAGSPTTTRLSSRSKTAT